ncbi:MAG: TfoX/Sxy family protein [Clostridia bacterium]|nr:TfoX/Sxy family protein [Clostridia bacterium]
MASSVEYLTYVLDLLREVDGITYKKMMGEFLLYKDGVLFGGVYDDRFLVKKTPSLQDFDLSEELPYEGAKPMLVVDSDDAEEVKEIVLKVCSAISKR